MCKSCGQDIFYGQTAYQVRFGHVDDETGTDFYPDEDVAYFHDYCYDGLFPEPEPD